MTWYVFIPFGGGGGGGGKEFAPWVVVGNELAGDTIADCDILDTGNGAGIAAAIALAGPSQSDVWIRPGTYDLGAAGGPGSLTIQPTMTVRGAGPFSTTIVASDTTRRAIVVDTYALLENLYVTANGAAAGAVGAGLVELREGAQCRRVYTFLSIVNADETLRAGFDFQSFGAGCEECFSYGASYTTFNPATTTYFACYRDTYNIGSDIAQPPNRVENCRSEGGDIGYYSEGSTEFNACVSVFATYRGARLAGRSGASIIGGNYGLIEQLGVTQIGIEIGGSSQAESRARRARVVGAKVYLADGFVTPMAEGIRINGRGCVVHANEVTGATISYRLAGDSENCLVVGNIGETGSTLVQDDGTTNEVAHNIAAL